ncbi:SAM-dependent methyltransferase [Pseudothauera lacus]|uniref:SAM-dependent methyltransferase n=1 Tax=Pseudothauera lacus TaxID=2136175 RepID=A0A2T4IGD4_9RHOO|nr:SAM-dependent methyltransferase [Pseudothauera lacus]PTD96839.1 SAM-dependent methyltransferase [Pseudothauera lacus]
MTHLLTTQLPFTAEYDPWEGTVELKKASAGLRRRIENLRTEEILRRALALAGEPLQVLDLHGHAGRFWNTLAEQPTRHILAAAPTEAELDLAIHYHGSVLRGRITALAAPTPTHLALADGAADCVLCLRALLRIGSAVERHAVLRELHRVSRSSVILALRVDGNLQAWRRQRRHLRRLLRGEASTARGDVLTRSAAAEAFDAAGFDILTHFDILPRWGMERIYVLRRR